jgi:VIT1/CCC1 family predicted Fe2+/Mn2+ transporter
MLPVWEADQRGRDGALICRLFGLQVEAARGRIWRMTHDDRPSSATGTAALQAGWSHGHRDVSGGWLRPAVFGAVDGLVTNASLISGLGGGGVSAHTVMLTGVAALVAGAFSMGTGEYISVTNQNELVHSEVSLERQMLHRFPAAEQEELAGYFRQYGADPETAARMAAAVSADPGTALRVHTREELGVLSLIYSFLNVSYLLTRQLAFFSYLFSDLLEPARYLPTLILGKWRVAGVGLSYVGDQLSGTLHFCPIVGRHSRQRSYRGIAAGHRSPGVTVRA